MEGILESVEAARRRYAGRDVAHQPEVEVVFEPQEEGGYYVYSPDLPGLHTQGETLAEAERNAAEAIELYVESLREGGRPVSADVIRRKFPLPV